MSSATAELRLGFGVGTVLEQVSWLPLVRLDRRADHVTAVVFHSRTVALLDGRRQQAEVAVSQIDIDRTLREHHGTDRGPLGVKVHLSSPSRIRTAVELIERAVDEAKYQWQASTANP